MENAILEQRTLQIRDVSTDDNVMKVAGYVNKNNSVSEVLSEDGQVFRETILPQAFTSALQRADEICFFLEHDPKKILATTKNDTLNVSQDDVGLHMSANIVPTTDGENAYKLIKSGIITNMSFGFLVNDDSWSTEEGQVPLRTVTDLDLIEVSAVKNPAYTSSSIQARSKNKLMNKSKISLRDKGGVKKMKIEDFDTDALKDELNKRAKEDSAKEDRADDVKDVEKRDDTSVSNQDILALANKLVDMCTAMCSSMNAGGVMETDSKDEAKTEKRSSDEDVEDETKTDKDVDDKAEDKGEEKHDEADDKADDEPKDEEKHDKGEDKAEGKGSEHDEEPKDEKRSVGEDISAFLSGLEEDK